jgi:hypothetical protein
MRITTLAFVIVFALGCQSPSTAVAQKSNDQPSPRQAKVAIDPRSSGETEVELLAPGFRNSCPSVSIVRDESEAEYVVLASQASSGFFLHYYITVYDKQEQGKVVFTADKHLAKNTVKAFCQFMNGQK